MAYINFSQHEAQILITADHRKGIWGSQIAIRNGRASRTAGSLPTCAHRHLLLAVALLSGIRSISRKQAATLVSTATEPIQKPRVRVVTQDVTFADALTAATNRQAGKPLRVGKNFVRALAAQVARVDLSITTVPADDAALHTLKTWIRQNVIDPKEIEHVPAALAPTVASVLL